MRTVRGILSALLKIFPSRTSFRKYNEVRFLDENGKEVTLCPEDVHIGELIYNFTVYNKDIVIHMPDGKCKEDFIWPMHYAKILPSGELDQLSFF